MNSKTPTPTRRTVENRRPRPVVNMPNIDRRRHTDPDKLSDRVRWIPVKLLSIAFLFTLATVVMAPDMVTAPGAMITLVIFAVALNCSILLPISHIIIYWNQSMFAHRFRQR